MIKRVEVEMSPTFYGSAEKMGNFLMALSTSGAELVDLSICITMCGSFHKNKRRDQKTLPPLSLFDRSLVGDHPIVAGLFSLKAVKKLKILMLDEARFGPDVADALREAFMREGTADGRSITIDKVCTFPHKELERKERCPCCGKTAGEWVYDPANWEYKDDMITWRAVSIFDSFGRKLKQREAKLVTGKTITIKAREPQTTAAAADHTTPTQQTKAKLMKASSKDVA